MGRQFFTLAFKFSPAKLSIFERITKSTNMKFQKPLVHGYLIKRYKRFLADIKLDNGNIITAHCTNSGSMKSCIEEGAEVYLTHHNDPKRRTQYTWEMIKINGQWVGINTSNPNALVFEAIQQKLILGLDMYDHVYREVKFDESRLDILAENNVERCAIEVKNVTLKEDDWALFPDSVTERGLKHLQTLMRLKSEGMRVAMVYIIQRMDVTKFAPAMNIDPAYAQGFQMAVEHGVEVFPLQTQVTPNDIQIIKKLPFFINYQSI
jgi:sugar fermentation stimulation protein A